MLEHILKDRAANTEAQAKLQEVQVGTIVVWYSTKKKQRVVYARIVEASSSGVVLDAYPEGTVPYVIPWYMMVKTQYGYTVLCDDATSNGYNYYAIFEKVPGSIERRPRAIFIK